MRELSGGKLHDLPSRAQEGDKEGSLGVYFT